MRSGLQLRRSPAFLVPEVWMAILKTAQALRTSVSEGTSLVQCSYVPSEEPGTDLGRI